MRRNGSEILNQFSPEEFEKVKSFLSFFPTLGQMSITPNGIPLGCFIKEYSEFIKLNRSAAYHTSVVLSFNHMLKYFGPQKLISSISLRDLEALMSFLQQKVPKGFRVYYKNFKAAFNKARDWGYVSENFFMKIKLPKKQQINPCFINETQLKLICDQIENEELKEMVIIAFYTGMRRDELAKLRWGNINLSQKVVTVGDAAFTTKGRNQRYIPICNEAMLILAAKSAKRNLSPMNEDFIFCKPDGKNFSGDYISKVFKRACIAAGIDPSIHYHSLRHSFASYLAQKDVSLYTIQKLLGHSSFQTTQIYSHLSIESLQAAISKFDEVTNCPNINGGVI